MTIALRAAGTIAELTAAATSLSVPYPAGLVSNDLMVLAVPNGGSGATTISTPSGWTSRAQFGNSASSQSPAIAVFTKFATGSESGNLSVTQSSIVSSGQIIAFSGVDTTTPMDVSPALSDITTASTSAALTGLTVATAGAALVAILSGNSTTATATPPSGFTETADHVTASARSWEVSYKLGQATGATGTITATWSSSIRYDGVLLALRPASTTVPYKFWTGSAWSAAVNVKTWSGSAWV